MNIFRRVKNLFRNIYNLALNDPKAWDSSLWRFAGAQSLSGEVVTEETALTYSAVWNAITLISGTVGSLPLHLMQGQGKKKRIADNDPLYYIMHDKPNPFMTSMVFRRTMAAHVVSWGNAYAEIVRNGQGDIVALWPIPPNRVLKVEPRDDGNLWYEIQVGNKTTWLPREKVLHIAGPSFDGYIGYSVIAMARKGIGLGMAMETFGSKYFGDGIHPSGIITHPNQLKDPAAMRKALSEVYAGLGNAQRLMLLEDGMKFDKMSINPEDSQFIESRTFQIPEIARWFNLPPHKLKDLTKSSFCLPAEVEIYTQVGPKPIAAILPGDQVWSLASNKWQLSPVIRSEVTGIDQIFTIKTTNRTIRCNAKHPLLVRVKSGDHWESRWIQASQLGIGDIIVTLKNLPEFQIIPKRWDGTDITVEFMEFCGLLIGDGNIIRQNGHPSWITIARSDNATYMDYYRKIANELFVAGGYEYRCGEQHPMSKLTEDEVNEIRERGKNILTNMDIAREYRANICSIQNIIHRTYHWESPCATLNEKQVKRIKHLVKTRETSDDIAKDYGISRDTVNKILSGEIWSKKKTITPITPIFIREVFNGTRFNSFSGAKELIDLGFSGVAKTKRVPDWIFESKDELKLGFLRGFLDADGHVDGKGRIAFSSCNKTMLSQVKHLCMGLGIPVTNLRCQEGITKLPNGTPKHFKQWSITCSDPGQNRKIGSHTPEYIKKMENGKPFGKKDRKYPKHGGEGFDIDGCSLARIVNIDKSLIHEPVYDLAVDKTHSFIANGCVVHNSNIEAEQTSFVMDSILPWLILIEQQYNAQLLTESQQRQKKLYFKHIVEGLLRANSKDRAEYYKLLIGTGVMTPNEAREKEDMNPSTDPLADELWMPTGQIPLSKFGEYLSKNQGQPGQKQLPAPEEDPKLVDIKQKGLKLITNTN